MEAVFRERGQNIERRLCPRLDGAHQSSRQQIRRCRRGRPDRYNRFDKFNKLDEFNKPGNLNQLD
jgi:hypothetical protein